MKTTWDNEWRAIAGGMCTGNRFDVLICGDEDARGMSTIFKTLNLEQAVELYKSIENAIAEIVERHNDQLRLADYVYEQLRPDKGDI